MNYFQYLFSDKKATLFWIVYYTIIFSIILGGFLISYFGDNSSSFNESIPVYSIITTVIIIFGFPIFYSFSFLNYKKQEKFKRKYSYFFKNNLITKNVEITTSEKVKAPITNHQVKINNKITDNYTVMSYENMIVVLGQVRFLGILRHHLKPILISLDKKPIEKKFDFTTIPKHYIIREKDNNLIINFLKSNIGLEQLLILDWSNYIKNNHSQV